MVHARPVKKQLTEAQKASIVTVTAHSYGRLYRSIAVDMGLHHQTISKVCRQYEQTSRLSRTLGSRRKRKTTVTDDRHIKRMVRKKPDITGKEILEGLGRHSICERTVRRRISEGRGTTR